jgi:hypothetical protein
MPNIEKILGGLHIKEAKHVIDEIIIFISKQNADNIIFAIMQLLKAFRNINIEINRTKQEPVTIDFTNFKKRLLELETLKEIQQAIYDYIDETYNFSDGSNKNKYLNIVETMKNIVI